jgi:phosphoribosyl 1,2-cyclic phosphate phosphodiesterase
MNVYFLGTGTSQGIPVIGSNHPVCKSNNQKDKRLRVSVWIYDKNFSIVIDCGPDFRQQMLTSKCDKIDAILFTHEHADHTAGLDDIRPYNFKQQMALPIFAHKRVLQNLTKRFDYIFETENRYPGAPMVTINEVENNKSFFIGDKEIIPIDFLHGKLQVFGYRIGNFAYLTDMKSITNVEIAKLKGVKVMVVNALREEEHYSHFSLQEALDFIHLIQPEKTFLTHISHIMGFHDDVQKKLPKNVYLAYDNLEIQV